LALLLVILGWWGYRTWQVRQEHAAQRLLTQALTSLDPTAPTPEGEEAEQPFSREGEDALQLLQRTRQEYPSTAAAEQALLQIGNVHYQRGEYDSALEAYQTYLGQYPNGGWVLLAIVGKGYALESEGRYQDAALTFRALADRYKHHTLGAEALMGLGRCLTALDQPKKAVEVYERLITDYPATPWARQAQMQIASLQR
jgi:TolA-binding protein